MAAPLPEAAGTDSRPRPGTRRRGALPELVGVEVSLATGPLQDLERTVAAIPSDRLAGLFDATPELLELVALRTCHRMELWAWTASPTTSLAALQELVPSGVPCRRLIGTEALRHLYRVTAGLESIAVGEREVRDQVRLAAGRVLTRQPRPVLRPIFLGAAEAVDRILPSVPASRSIAALAAAKVLEESPVPFPRVLIAGSGVVGSEAAELLASSGRLTILYRTRPPDEGFLRATGARAAPWSALADELRLADAVILATKSGDRLLGPETLYGRDRPLLVVDLGMPRNAAPSLGARPHVRLIDLDGLRPRARPPGAPPVEAEVDRAADEGEVAVRAHALEAWVDEFRRAVEDKRREILDAAAPFLGPLTAEQQLAVDRLTRRLATQLTHGPTRGLRSLPSGAAGDELREWLLAWLPPPDGRT